MAEKLTPAMKALKEAKRRINLRLMRAYREGRLHEEALKMEQEADLWWKNGDAAPRRRRKTR